MYNILIVDDEPLICKGLCRLLESSGLNIGQIYTAYDGYEALDNIRMEDIDLVVTDIQMGEMNGIELMSQAKIIKPWIETIVISAHETFQYAQMAIRLGAKDYLIKPLNNRQFLDSVRSVLLHSEGPESTEDELLSGMREHFQMKEPDPSKIKFLNELLDQETIGSDLVELAGTKYHLQIKGPYFAVIRIRLIFPDMSDREKDILQYAALNISNELLDQQWNLAAFYSPEREICIIIQWNDENYDDTTVNKITKLEIVGRSLQFNIHKYLHLSNVVGISQILKGVEFLPVLNNQARKAIQWNQEHPDHFVFYYGDFKWNLHAEEASQEDWMAQHNMIVVKAKEYIDSNYNRKGITLNEVAQKIHVSPNYLSYLFKKYVGCNLWEYVIKLRMDESKRLIQTTDLRRYEISDRVGYESPEHFSKIFKKYFGISPSEMKK